MIISHIPYSVCVSSWIVAGGRNISDDTLLEHRYAQSSHTSELLFITWDFPDFSFRNLKKRNVVLAGVNIINKHSKGLKNNVAIGELSD